MAVPDGWQKRLETAGLVGIVLGLLLLFPLGGVPESRDLLVFLEVARLIGLAMVIVGLGLYLALARPWQS